MYVEMNTATAQQSPNDQWKLSFFEISRIRWPFPMIRAIPRAKSATRHMDALSPNIHIPFCYFIHPSESLPEYRLLSIYSLDQCGVRPCSSRFFRSLRTLGFRYQGLYITSGIPDSLFSSQISTQVTTMAISLLFDLLATRC